MVTDRCKRCKYSGTVAYEVPCCDYCFLTGKMRGCPSGDECNKFDDKITETHLDRMKKGMKNIAKNYSRA